MSAARSQRALSIDLALVGRPNAGKSSLYNAITGGDAKVGNFPGITVDVLEAAAPLPGGGQAHFFDLPGVYSLGDDVDADSDEGQARACIDRLEARGGAFAIAQVVDATQLVLGLRLTREILARGWPTLVLITQRDVLEKSGARVDTAFLERELGVPVLAVSARDKDVRARVLEAVTAIAERNFPRAAARTFEPRELADRATKRVSLRPAKERTARADAVLLHPVLGPIIFVLVMTALFSAVFLVADPASNALDVILGRLSSRITGVLGAHWWTSLVCDGVLGGAGTVLAFLPQIVVLTLALEIIDASGYLARGAFLVDRVLRLAGLGGKSFVPLLTAHACAVPAIASTRIVRDPKQRLRTLLVIPLMTCSARIPTYGLLIAAFFRHRSALFQAAIFVCLYSAGILAGFFASLVIGKTTERRGARTLPLVLEMPAYRVPQARVVARMAWRSCIRFLREVGTVIVLASVALWVLMKIPSPGQPNDPQHSVAASIGHALEPVTKPLGFDWRIDVGLIGSFGARELMVSTLGVTYGVEQDAKDNPAPLADRIGSDPAYSVATGLALMAFFVLACQCMSTVAALRRETKGWKVPVFVLAYTYAAAYVAALVVYQVARAVG
ncbi:MAG TPA: ferrous iron transporter B [Polyangiaceae bacterium]|jgi:ferrous iron transport protein B